MKREADLFHQRPEPVIGKLVPNPIGSMNYNVLAEILQETGTLQLHYGAEIGVFEGHTSAHLLRRFPRLKLICVDPFIAYDENEPDKTQQKMLEVERQARERLAQFEPRVEIQKKFSVEAAMSVADESLDFVFIDGLHTYKAVTEDIRAWYPKVRKGGLISGHDLSWPEVQRAVEDFLVDIKSGGLFTPSTSDVWLCWK